MQVGGNYNSNYNSYSNADYSYPTHTHHFTECLHEEQIPKKKQGEAAASQGVTLEIQGNSMEETGKVIPEAQGTVTEGFWKKGLGFMQGLWDALGKDGSQQADRMTTLEMEDPATGKGLFRSVATIVPSIRQGFHVLVVERFEEVRDKLKVGIHTALKRFGKGRDSFGTLTDPGTGSLLGGRTGNGASRKQDKSGTRQGQEEEIKTAPMANEHLMDSYNKSGTYCKLGENLTYSKGRAPYKVSGRNRQEKRGDSF